MAAAPAWLERASLPVSELEKTRTLRLALDALSVTLEGTAAAATTIRRKRAVLHNSLEYAVEIEKLSANKLGQVAWRPAKVAEIVDPRVVVNPRQARELFTAVTYVGQLDRARHMRGFFACLYFAGLRPGEALGLRVDDCYLPRSGWGKLTLVRSRPKANRRWTDTGESHDERGLKHRGSNETRPVPIPPELVTILREHLAEFGVATDGRLFRTRREGMLTNHGKVWVAARPLALTPDQIASPLANNPYSLRHAAVSLCLTPACRPLTSPSELGTVWTSCFVYTPSASTAGKRSRTRGSNGRCPPDDAP